MLTFGGFLLKENDTDLTLKVKRKIKEAMIKKSDEVNWIELKNVLGKPGWLYGKSVYFVFIIGEKAVYVSKKDLINLVNKNIIKNKIVHENPLEFYTQYQRKGRKDIIIKVPNKETRNISNMMESRLTVI